MITEFFVSKHNLASVQNHQLKGMQSTLFKVAEHWNRCAVATMAFCGESWATWITSRKHYSFQEAL